MAKRTPNETLHRVMRIARLDGWSIAIFAGLCALVSLVTGDLVGAVVGLIVAAGGVVELRGLKKLTQHDAEGGMTLLIRAQLIVLGSIWCYALGKLAGFDAETAMNGMTPDMKTMIDQVGLSTAEIVRLLRVTFYGMYATVLVVTLIYQGGLALYYRNRRETVREALTAPPEIPIRPTA
jgi:hypothetical protein